MRVRTGSLRFIEETVSIRDSMDIERYLKNYSGESARKTLLRAHLTGRVPREVLSEVGLLRQQLSDRLLLCELLTAGLREDITLEEIDHEYPQGSFPHQLLSRLAAAGDAAALSLAQQLLEEAGK